MMMQINVTVMGVCDEKDSHHLNELKSYIEDELQVRVNSSQAYVEGSKSTGLTTGLEIAGIILSSISTFVTVLQYWQSNKKSYKIIYKSENIEIELNNLTHNEIVDLLKSDSSTEKQSVIKLVK